MSNEDWKEIEDRTLRPSSLISWAHEPWFNASKIQSIPLDTTTFPQNQQVLTYDGTLDVLAFQNVPVSATGPTGAVGVTGAQGSTGLQGPTGPIGASVGFSEGYRCFDTKTSGTQGGSANGTAWTTRTLNTITTTGGINVTLATNLMLIRAGNWYVFVSSPFYRVSTCSIRLFNTTTGVVQALGSSSFASSATTSDQTSVLCFISTAFTITGNGARYSVQYRASGPTSTSDLGRATGFGTNEVYTQVTLIRYG